MYEWLRDAHSNSRRLSLRRHGCGIATAGCPRFSPCVHSIESEKMLRDWGSSSCILVQWTGVVLVRSIFYCAILYSATSATRATRARRRCGQTGSENGCSRVTRARKQIWMKTRFSNSGGEICSWPDIIPQIRDAYEKQYFVKSRSAASLSVLILDL